VRVAGGEHRAVLPEHRDPKAAREIDAAIDLGEILRIDGADRDAGEAAVEIFEPQRHDDAPAVLGRQRRGRDVEPAHAFVAQRAEHRRVRHAATRRVGARGAGDALAVLIVPANLAEDRRAAAQRREVEEERSLGTVDAARRVGAQARDAAQRFLGAVECARGVRGEQPRDIACVALRALERLAVGFRLGDGEMGGEADEEDDHGGRDLPARRLKIATAGGRHAAEAAGLRGRKARGPRRRVVGRRGNGLGRHSLVRPQRHDRTARGARGGRLGAAQVAGRGVAHRRYRR